MKKLLLLTMTALAIPAISNAASITLTNSDSLGNSSFNAKLNWNSASAPIGGNSYFTGEQFRLRTPANGNSFIFGGDSLTLNSTNAGNGGLMYKGTGNTGVLTINNLILAGGWIHHQNGLGDLFQLAGGINVVSDSTIWAKQGNINISSVISGSANLTIQPTDATAEDNRYVTLLGNNSPFTGKIIMGGLARLRILSEESLGGNPASFTADQFTFNNGWLVATNTFAINDGNRGITVGAGGGTFNVADSNATLTVAVPITGGGVLTKIGAGALTLSGNNDFSGGLTFSAGAQLNLNSATALGFGVLTLNVAGMKLDNTSGSARGLTTANPQTWNNSFTFLGSSSLDAGAGAVTMFTNVTVTVSNSTLTVSTVLDDGSGRSLTKQGPGTLTIRDGGYYAGNTFVNEGVLALTGSGSLSSPTINVATNAMLNVTGVGGLTLTFGQTLAGSGTVVGNVADGAGATVISPGTSPGTLIINGNLGLNGGGVLNFELGPSTTAGSGINDLIVVTGQLNLAGATTLNLTGTPAVGTYTLLQYGSFAGSLANVTVPPGFVLNNNTSAKTIELVVTHVPASLTWLGDGVANTWDLGVTANWIQDGTNQFFFTGDSAIFDDSGSNSPSINLAAAMSPAAVTVNAVQDYTFTGSPIVTGSLTKNGPGTLVLENDNTYAGPTVITAGNLQVGNGGNAGRIGTGPVSNNGALILNRADDLTVANAISGSGLVTQFGGATVGLTASNSYAGTTTINSGILAARNSSALGTAAAGTLVNPGGQLLIDANVNITNESLNLSGAGPGNGALRKGGGGATFWTGPISVFSEATIQIDGGATLNLTDAGGISGSDAPLILAADGGAQGFVTGPITIGDVALTKSGAGNWTLAATNTYTGKTFINGGTLFIQALSSLGPIVTPTPDFVTFGGGLLGVTTNLTFNDGQRGFTLAGDGGFNVPTNATLTVANAITGTGNLSKWGEGALILNGNNSFTGILNLDRGGDGNLSDGITRLTSAAAIANVTAIQTRRTSVGTAGGATLQLDPIAGSMVLGQPFSLTCRNNTTTPTIQNLSGTNTLSGPFYIFTGGNQVTYQAEANSRLVLSGPIQYHGTLLAARNLRFPGSGEVLVTGAILLSTNGTTPVNVVKAGSGTLTLAGANTYSGTTTNEAGLCLVTGSITSTGMVSVVGGVLAGTGTINAPVFVETGGTLAPGASVGTLTINNDLTLTGTTAIEVNKSNGQRDRVIGVGKVTYGGTLFATNIAGAPVIGDNFAIFSATTSSGNFTNIVGTPGPGLVWSFNPTNGALSVVQGYPSTRTNITYSVTGNLLTLSWPANYLGGVLQVQTNSINVGIGANWVDVPGSAAVTTTNLTINPANPSVFFRLRHP